MALVGYIVYLRLSKKLGLQEIRIKLYENLHEDLGSRLTTIVLTLDQVLMKRADRFNNVGEVLNGADVDAVTETETQAETKTLTKTKDIAYNIVGNMRRLVWATDPDNDELSDIAQQLTSDANVLLPENIIFTLNIDPHLFKIKIDGTRRYQMLSAAIAEYYFLRWCVFDTCGG